MLTVLGRFESLYPMTEPEKRTPVKTLNEEFKGVAPRLESNFKTITTTNTVAAFKDHVIHNLSDYRRNDETLLLLPKIEVSLDHLLIFKDEERELYVGSN